jgi:hypothetical protein
MAPSKAVQPGTSEAAVAREAIRIAAPPIFARLASIARLRIHLQPMARVRRGSTKATHPND